MSEALHWALIGEYPPAQGGVSDYAAQLAAALAAAGDYVDVWAPGVVGGMEAGVTVHPLPDRFGRRSRTQLGKELAALAPKARWLIQYTPQIYGHRAMNWRFCRWVLRQRNQHPWVMFHEVAFHREPGQNPYQHMLALTTRRMAAWMRRAAAKSFVAIPAWDTLLRQLAPDVGPSTWLPVPSNLPTAVDPTVVAEARRQLIGGDDERQRRRLVIGCFCGGVNDYARAGWRGTIPRLLAADPHRIAMFLGAEGARLRRQILLRAPELGPQLRAPGYLPAPEASALLAATDLLIQPYIDGVSSRRSSVMAGLALGRALLTTEGRLTEPLWRSSGGVALTAATENPASALSAAAEVLLRDPERRQALGKAGQRLYRERFALDHTVRALRTAAASS